MAAQTDEEIRSVLSGLSGATVAAIQVLGINSLKSLDPTPDALVGEPITSTAVSNRVVTLLTPKFRGVFDLQRTGKVIWVDEAKLYTVSQTVTRPTVRLILANRQGVDMLEPGRTKRITATFSDHG